MTDAHKEALSTGREEGRAVRNYLEAIDRPKRRGRKKTVESVARRIDQLDARLSKASPSERLRLIQQRFDLKSELDALSADAALDLQQLEDSFVKVASDYSERKGISYAAWREAGVSPAVLRRAGIPRTRVH